MQGQYYNLDATGHLQVQNSGQDSAFGERTGIAGFAYFPDQTGHGYVRLGEQASFPKEPNYRIVDTDYSTYSIVYGCGKIGTSQLFLLTREAVISQELYDFMIATVKEKLPNFDLGTLHQRDYQGPLCTYAPMPDAAESFLQ